MVNGKIDDPVVLFSCCVAEGCIMCEFIEVYHVFYSMSFGFMSHCVASFMAFGGVNVRVLFSVSKTHTHHMCCVVQGIQEMSWAGRYDGKGVEEKGKEREQRRLLKGQGQRARRDGKARDQRVQKTRTRTKQTDRKINLLCRIIVWFASRNSSSRTCAVGLVIECDMD